MATAAINGELSLSYPDSFHVMDADEMTQAFSVASPQMWAIWDTENHMIVSVVWQNSNKLIAGLASTKSLIERVEKSTAKTYRADGYTMDGYFTTSVCGNDAMGFRYSYTRFDVEQAGEVLLFKHGAACYTVYCVERAELAEQTHALFDGIVSSMSIA